MFEEFKSYFNTYSKLSEEAISIMWALAVPRTLRRNEILLANGEICRHKVFILEGLLRTFGVTAEGNEYILQFSPENTWTLDAESYDRQIPTTFCIDAVEPSKILLWSKTDFERLRLEIPELKTLSEQLISRSGYYNRQRIMTALSATPEEKYEDFIHSFPGLASRVPLRMIASYLGISIKTLTRTRHAQVHRESK